MLTSDFVQASEAELLSAVIKWGELAVARRQMEGGTATGELITLPGAGRRGGRRRDGLCDREVAEAVCDLVGCVRLEHLLAPGGEELVRQASERGIINNHLKKLGIRIVSSDTTFQNKISVAKGLQTIVAMP